MTPQEHQNRIQNLKQKLQGLRKEAFAPPGAPPMDPAMMGGAPPMDPAMMGGAPPMDPAMMGGAPPMDPAMMGGAPPMDPAMAAAMAAPAPSPAPAGDDTIVALSERVDAIGYMLLKLCETLNIPLDQEDAGDGAAEAARALAPEAEAAMANQSEADAQAADPLSEHAQEAAGEGGKDGFLKGQINKFNA